MKPFIVTLAARTYVLGRRLLINVNVVQMINLRFVYLHIIYK